MYFIHHWKLENYQLVHDITPTFTFIHILSFISQVFRVVSTDVDTPPATLRYYFTSTTPTEPQPFVMDYITGMNLLDLV